MPTVELEPTGPPVHFRDLVRRLLNGPVPTGRQFDACRALLRAEPGGASAFEALCVLLEGALADPSLSSDDTQVIVPLLKALARGTIAVQDVT